MSLFSRLPNFSGALVSAGLLLSSPVARAQIAAPAGAVAARGYDFLTVTCAEASIKAEAKILITPAFQGKSVIQLEDFGGFSAEKSLAKLQHNTELINRQLSDLTVAGWELVQVYPFTSVPGLFTTRYLFRKAKN